MMKFAALLASALVLALSPMPAEAHHTTKKGKAAKVRYGGKPGLGYWRPGPKRGYGFRFSSYKGDPFSSDDYYDGDRCYYVHHTNYCVKNRIFMGIGHGPTHR